MTDPAIVGEEPTRKWREDKVRPLPGTLRTTGSVKPGTGIVKESLRRSLLATLTLVPIERTILGAQYAFWKAWRNLSGPMGFQNQNQNQNQNQTLGRDRAASRQSAPGPGKRTRREDHALSHRPQMSSDRAIP